MTDANTGAQSVNTASACPLLYVMVLQSRPQFTQTNAHIIDKKYNHYIESLLRSPGYDMFWHHGIGFTNMHEAQCRLHLGDRISELPIKYLPSKQRLQFLAYDIFKTFPFRTDVIALSYIGRDEKIAGVITWRKTEHGEGGAYRIWEYNHPIDFDTTEPQYVSRRFERIEECAPTDRGIFIEPDNYVSGIRYDRKEILL